MAININTGFKLLNEAESLDSRCLYKTVAEMADATVGIYEGCVAYVSTGDEKGYYTFNKNNDLDPTLGLWRPLQLGGGGDVIADEFGEMLFTHFGVSGPLILSASSVILDDLKSQEKAKEYVLNRTITRPKTNVWSFFT